MRHSKNPLKRLIFPFIILVALAGCAVAIPGMPHQFYGKLNFLEPNATVTAYIDGAEVAKTTAINGSYGYFPNLFYVTDPDGDRQGKTITFFMNGVKADSIQLKSGAITRLDLVEATNAPGSCGDNICGSGESCETCQPDCGSCAHHSGGGSYYAPKKDNLTQEPAACIPEWICSDWMKCTDGTQNRLCADANKCGTDIGRPEMIRNCTVDLNQTEGFNAPPKEKVNWFKIIVPALILLGLLSLGAISFKPKKRK